MHHQPRAHICCHLLSESMLSAGSPHGVAVHDVMQIGRAVLLGPAGKPTLKLWPILLSDIANVLKLSAEGTERTPSPDADQAAAQHAAHEEPDVAAAIQALAIVTARCLGEATTSNAAIKLLPTDFSFLRSLSVLLLKSLQQYSSHRLGGILVILAAALAQLYAEEPMVTAEDPVMKEAVATGLIHLAHCLCFLHLSASVTAHFTSRCLADPCVAACARVMHMHQHQLID
jgi:hypothetical protein